MKRRLQGLVFALLCVPGAVYGAETAATRLFCLSLQFQTATMTGFGNTYTLQLTTASSAAPPNGELAPLFNPQDPRLYGSGFVFVDPTFNTPEYGTMNVDLPPFSDVNSNGFDDFFEVSQGVAGASTSGSYDITGVDNGSVAATWSRAAGSAVGTCNLSLTSSSFGPLGTFVAPFTVLEYTGPLRYTPGSNAVTGTVVLAQTGSPTHTLAGPVIFDKIATNRFNQLLLQPGTWTNAANLTLSFTNAMILRDPILGTNYYGTLWFATGDPATPEPDYQLWAISIDDTNDANTNGIPDFSDDPVPASAPPPL
ncbi:MAG: hypothetical protein KGS61_10770, partial [Verrucomicrobia bacterium]|nr:hypothetical protein [Verrucomicrobiota bacterium]